LLGMKALLQIHGVTTPRVKRSLEVA